MPDVVLDDPRLGDLGWVVERHGAVQASDEGWDLTFEALIAGIVGTFGTTHDPATERLWIARVDGERAGCVMCVRGDEPGLARLRILYVERTARGTGLGRRLVRECVDFARTAGYSRMELWTINTLAAARRIYADAGFRVVKEVPGIFWGENLVGETWSLQL
ncbi:MAG: GNAT family N-acetyltransferase [Mycobacteriales bacterium]